MRPTLPAGIDWSNPGVWEAFRLAFQVHVATERRITGSDDVYLMRSFQFHNRRFVPAYAKLLIQHYDAGDFNNLPV